MRALVLAVAAALIVPAAAQAQSAAEQMLATAKQIRANVEKLKDSLPAETRAGMLKSAEDIERSVANGDYGAVAAAPKEASLADQLMAKHGRLDWLTPLAACAGYTQENYTTFRYSPAINDRDAHCRNAHGHWATYLRYTRGGDAEGAGQALFYYDAAARRAVTLLGGR